MPFCSSRSPVFLAKNVYVIKLGRFSSIELNTRKSTYSDSLIDSLSDLHQLNIYLTTLSNEQKNELRIQLYIQYTLCNQRYVEKNINKKRTVSRPLLLCAITSYLPCEVGLTSGLFVIASHLHRKTRTPDHAAVTFTEI